LKAGNLASCLKLLCQTSFVAAHDVEPSENITTKDEVNIRKDEADTMKDEANTMKDEADTRKDEANTMKDEVSNRENDVVPEAKVEKMDDGKQEEHEFVETQTADEREDNMPTKESEKGTSASLMHSCP